MTDPAVHKEKRAALSPLFTQRAVLDLEPVIQKQIDRLNERLMEHSKDDKAVNFHFAFRAVAVDIVTDFCYATPYKFVSLLTPLSYPGVLTTSEQST